jgi:predicted DNA-binding transcriptional regulator YafY
MTTRTVYRDIRALEDELAMPIFQAGKPVRHREEILPPPLHPSVPEAVVLFLASTDRALVDAYDQAVVSAFTKLADLLPADRATWRRRCPTVGQPS